MYVCNTKKLKIYHKKPSRHMVGHINQVRKHHQRSHLHREQQVLRGNVGDTPNIRPGTQWSALSQPTWNTSLKSNKSLMSLSIMNFNTLKKNN